jgi:hypothetical protein
LRMPTSCGAPLPAEPAPVLEQASITDAAAPASTTRGYRIRDPTHNTLIPELPLGFLKV